MLSPRMYKKMVNLALGLFMKRPVQQLLLPFGRDLNPEKWIFVVGCYDSGTTLLATILGRLPGFGGLPNEGQFLTDRLPYPETYGWPRMFCKCLEELDIPGDPAEAAARIKRQWSVWYPRNAKYLVEKSITNMIRMEFLQAHFPQAYFIHIIRDGYAVAKGIQKNANMTRWGTRYDVYPIELCAEQWKVADDVVEEQKPGIRNYLPLYYEDFAGNTDESMKRVLGFLGLDEVNTDILDNAWKIHGSTSKIMNLNYREHDLLTDEDIEVIGRVAGDALARHSYGAPR